MEERPMDILKGMVGKAVNVILKNGITYQGKLKAFDIHTNIILEDCKEIHEGKSRKLNEVFIYGRNLEICWLNKK